jgi:hypothetical protein
VTTADRKPTARATTTTGRVNIEIIVQETWKFLYTLRRTAVCLYGCVKLRAGFINVGIADDETFDEWSSSDMDFRVLKMNEIKLLHSSDWHLICVLELHGVELIPRTVQNANALKVDSHDGKNDSSGLAQGRLADSANECLLRTSVPSHCAIDMNSSCRVRSQSASLALRRLIVPSGTRPSTGTTFRHLRTSFAPARSRDGSI